MNLNILLEATAILGTGFTQWCGSNRRYQTKKEMFGVAMCNQITKRRDKKKFAKKSRKRNRQ